MCLNATMYLEETGTIVIKLLQMYTFQTSNLSMPIMNLGYLQGRPSKNSTRTRVTKPLVKGFATIVDRNLSGHQ